METSLSNSNLDKHLISTVYTFPRLKTPRLRIRCFIKMRYMLLELSLKIRKIHVPLNIYRKTVTILLPYGQFKLGYDMINKLVEIK